MQARSSSCASVCGTLAEMPVFTRGARGTTTTASPPGRARRSPPGESEEERRCREREEGQARQGSRRALNDKLGVAAVGLRPAAAE